MIKLEIPYETLIAKLAPNRTVGEISKVDKSVYVQTPTGGYSNIIGVIEKETCNVIRIEFDNGSDFECSEKHLFSENGVPVTAKKVTQVDTPIGKTNVTNRVSLGVEPVYDIAINDPHWYLTEPNGIIHHNTFFALGTIKNFLEQHENGLVFYFETESAISREMFKQRGIDTRRVAILPVGTVQEFKNQSLKIVDNYEKQPEKQRQPVIMILDSLGNLSTTKEMADSLEGNETKDMTRAQVIKAAFRVLTLKLGRANIPLICTNHVYADMSGGPYAGNTMSGGSGLRYSSSSILMLTKAKEKDGDVVIGSVITCTAIKSRLTKEGSRVKVLIRFDGGLDRYYGLLQLAEEAGLIKKVSTRYEFEDGTKAFGKAINETPTKYWTKDLLVKLDEYVQKKFTYSSSPEIEESIDAVTEEVSDENEA